MLFNDHESTEEEVIEKYNQRGASEKNFDVQNNDFGWRNLPFSKMEENTVCILITSMLKNFYQHLLSKVSGIFPCINMKSRVNRRWTGKIIFRKFSGCFERSQFPKLLIINHRVF